ncbi:MAG: hypothetical protein H0U74_10625 [Bradymonadaceae bacterium]|nr:hypothetical protein [Lujinxingiaceae bacterium]
MLLATGWLGCLNVGELNLLSTGQDGVDAVHRDGTTPDDTYSKQDVGEQTDTDSKRDVGGHADTDSTRDVGEQADTDSTRDVGEQADTDDLPGDTASAPDVIADISDGDVEPEPPRCGDSTIDPNETCDPPGSCPTSCNDGNSCTVDTLVGSAQDCTAACSNAPITQCSNNDGCCPTGCSPAQDSDCAYDCRNLATWPAGWQSFEAQVVPLFNERRAQGATCGTVNYPAVGPLQVQTLVYQSARCHSLDQANHGVMSHAGSDGSSLGQRLTREGYNWSTAGENVARGQTSAAGVVTSWMNSPGHCSIIMSSNFVHVGIGYVKLDSGSHHWTAVFAKPR